jgi:hypothetical protein
MSTGRGVASGALVGLVEGREPGLRHRSAPARVGRFPLVPVRERQPPGGGRFDEAGDATRRTRLANERTTSRGGVQASRRSQSASDPESSSRRSRRERPGRTPQSGSASRSSASSARATHSGATARSRRQSAVPSLLIQTSASSRCSLASLRARSPVGRSAPDPELNAPFTSSERLRCGLWNRCSPLKGSVSSEGPTLAWTTSAGPSPH